jgi:hypothetical protein
MDRAYVAMHLEADRDHWWFRGGLAIIGAVLRRALPPGAHRWLELGCGSGSGNVLEALAEFGEAVGMEADETPAAAPRLRARVFGLEPTLVPHVCMPAGASLLLVARR